MVQGNHIEGDKMVEKKQTEQECFQDIRDILPTLLILVIGLVIMILVIPYAFRLVVIIVVIIGLIIVIIIKLVVMVLVISNTFSSVFKQLAQEREMNRVGIITSFQNAFPYRLGPYLN